MTERKFHKTVIQVTILSEEPYPGDADLEQIAYDITDGDCSGDIEEVSAEEVDGKAMADRLYELGSEPGFFQLDDDGNDVNDDDEGWEDEEEATNDQVPSGDSLHGDAPHDDRGRGG